MPLKQYDSTFLNEKMLLKQYDSIFLNENMPVKQYDSTFLNEDMPAKQYDSIFLNEDMPAKQYASIPRGKTPRKRPPAASLGAPGRKFSAAGSLFPGKRERRTEKSANFTLPAWSVCRHNTIQSP